MNKKTATFFALALLLPMFSGCNKGDNSPLDSNNPVTISIWHYYTGTQKKSFDDLISSFNSTVGRTKGIYVSASVKGSVTDLETLVNESADGKVGAEPLPDLFSSYADTAYGIQEKGKLCDISQYFTKDELSKYVDSYIKDGYIKGDDKLYLFPVAKSTEVMMVNKTDFDTFASACNVSYADLATIEGVVEVARKYYEYTDALTPDVANDGKAFYGRDSMSNYFVVGLKQLGYDIYSLEDGSPKVNIPKEALKRLWDNYYVPYVKGYFYSALKFRTDDLKMGKILAYTGSNSSVSFFPDKVINEDSDSSRNIDYKAMQIPVFNGGAKVNVQQGAGLAVTASDRLHEYASCEFLKWFTSAENNIEFSVNSSYLPVLKEANNISKIDSVISNKELSVNAKSYACIKAILNSFDSMNFYTSIVFKTCSSARKILDYNLSDKAVADKKAIDEAIAGGTTRDAAIAPYITEEAFNTWYEAFSTKLNNAVKG